MDNKINQICPDNNNSISETRKMNKEQINQQIKLLCKLIK